MSRSLAIALTSEARPAPVRGETASSTTSLEDRIDPVTAERTLPPPLVARLLPVPLVAWGLSVPRVVRLLSVLPLGLATDVSGFPREGRLSSRCFFEGFERLTDMTMSLSTTSIVTIGRGRHQMSRSGSDTWVWLKAGADPGDWWLEVQITGLAAERELELLDALRH